MTPIRNKKALRKFVGPAADRLRDDRLRQDRKNLSADAVWLMLKIGAVLLVVLGAAYLWGPK